MVRAMTRSDSGNLLLASTAAHPGNFATLSSPETRNNTPTSARPIAAISGGAARPLLASAFIILVSSRADAIVLQLPREHCELSGVLRRLEAKFTYHSS